MSSDATEAGEYCGSNRNSWYDDDLQLAAELGKTLLERNLDLEAQLQHSIHLQNEQKLEIDLLQKQLEVLRNVNESRMRMYEDVDRNSHELEKLNSQLMRDRKTDRECINSLTETVQKLEERCEELQVVYERISKEENLRKREKRVQSVPSLVKAVNDEHNFRNGCDYLGFPSLYSSYPNARQDGSTRKLESMQQTLKKFELQISIEQNKRKVAETELANAMQEIKLLEEKLEGFVAKQSDQKIVETVKETETAKQSQDVVCTECRAQRPMKLVADKSEMIEHDIEEVPHGQLVRLKNGGSAYGSRESLHMIGLETDDTTPSLEVCSAILASDVTERLILERQSQEPVVKSNFSLLGELEEQYRKLVIRYETLIETKSVQRSPVKLDMATQDNLDSQQSGRPKDLMVASEESSSKRSSVALDFCSPVDPIEGHFENGPPEYKRLFKEIFQTLRRSVVYEDDASPATSTN